MNIFKIILAMTLFVISCTSKKYNDIYLNEWITFHSSNLIEISNGFNYSQEVYQNPSLLFKSNKKDINISYIISNCNDAEEIAKCYLKITKNYDFKIIAIKQFESLWIIHTLKETKTEDDNNVLIISKYNGEFILNRHDIHPK